MMSLYVLPAAAYEKVNKESEVDKTVCTHLVNDWSNPLLVYFVFVMSTGGSCTPKCALDLILHTSRL